MKLGVVAYVPPPRFGHPAQFLKNLAKFKPANELILYSDHDYHGLRGIPDPESIKSAHRFAVNNLIFFHGLRLAIQAKLDYMLYVEADSRVGVEGWDKVMFDEFFEDKFQSRVPDEPLLGGSIVCYNPYNGGRQSAEAFTEFVVNENGPDNYRKPVAVRVPVPPIYGHKGAADSTGSAVFPNGSLGIYSIELLKELFGKNEIVKLAQESFAWDMEIGKRFWKKYEWYSYRLVKNLKSVYSSYGEEITTEKERQDMLVSGQVVATHQIKSAWEGP